MCRLKVFLTVFCFLAVYVFAQTPWVSHEFRKYHRVHTKVDFNCSFNPSYCTTPLETAEDLGKALWPEHIVPYLECMDLPCQCPAFNGTVKDGKCILPDGRTLKKAVRKEYRQLTDAERQSFIDVMNELHWDGTYNQIGNLHKTAGIHSGPAFFPWHREFLKRVELLLRLSDPDLALPYWDSTLDNFIELPENSSLFSRDLLGDQDKDGAVFDTVFTNWTTMDGRPTWFRLLNTDRDSELITNGRIEFVLNQTDVEKVMVFSMPLVLCDIELDERYLEYSHDYVHYFLSGDMHIPQTSSNDPIFFMHHSFIDMLWELWRLKQQTREEREDQYPRDDLECAPSWHFKNATLPLLGLKFTNKDGLSNKYADNLVEYAPRPTCQKNSEECKSKFLFCDPRPEPHGPHCVAKIKLGGDCSGFEDFSEEACYNSVCINKTCVKSDSKPIKVTEKSEKVPAEVEKHFQ